MQEKKDYKTYHPKTRSAWRKWLGKNHSMSPGIWMVYYKKDTGKRKFSMAEEVEEALCFGWIDSVAQKLDDERAIQKFTPRKPKSVWSKLNKQRIEKLIEQKLMTPAGLAKIEQAKQNGSWETLNSSDLHVDNKSMHDELRKALSKKNKTLENIIAFHPSNKKILYFTQLPGHL